MALLANAACTRTFYRHQADREAYCALDQKAIPANSVPGEFRVAVDPRSRMFDPFDPDVEPMPPDDPASSRYLQCVDGKRGSSDWSNLPKTDFVDNPNWQAHLPRDEKGEVTIDQQGAVELALIHSPRYQSQLEDLFLSALDVTFERFRFDTQFFGGSDIFLTAEGRDRAGGNSSTELTVSPARPGNRWRAERLTATGGELVVGFANSLVWQFSGNNNYDSTTLLDFTLIQPLLRSGGRTVVLERLTIAERALLANVRQMERWRRGFYVQILTGRDAGQGPSRRGGFFGGAGLEGFSGVGGGGFGRVGGFGGGFGGGGGGFTGGAGAESAGGYYGLLQDQQELRNQRANVAALRDSVTQLEASYDAGRIDRFQVDLARQALYNAQSQLLTAEAAYKASVEGFQTGLGLPPELSIQIRDPFLDHFNLLDTQLELVKAQVADALGLLRDRRQQLVDLQGSPEEAAVEAQLEEELTATDEALVRLVEEIDARIEAVERDFAALDQTLPARRSALTELSGREEVQETRLDPALLSPVRLDSYVDARRSEFARLKEVLDNTSANLMAYDPRGAATPLENVSAAIDLLSRAASDLLELSLLQASVRLEAVSIDPIELEPYEALAIASAHRRDWMNARANLVDAWRLIYFNANDLESDLDLIFSGDIGNMGQNPFDLRGSNGRLRLGLQFDAPLTRLAERNVYRQSLIEYQQARRNYYQFRDSTYLSLRNTLRQIRLNEINLELRRAAVQLAISQVDLTQLRLSEPPMPGETSELSNTTARDLVQSLSDLLNVQNDFLSVWVNYEVQQLALELDLGVMELDSRGLRIDAKRSYATLLEDLPIYPGDLKPGMGCVPMEELRPASEVLPELRLMPHLQPEELASELEPAEELNLPEAAPEGPLANPVR